MEWKNIPLVVLWQREFAGYHWAMLQRDILAGLTVGAVALPLALAFGVASGADAAAGLVTAILAGLIIAGFGGGSYQISGPTGAMSAVLITLSQKYGLSGIWVASIIAGLLLILLGLFRLGRYISFIPSPVITGFTSGIALIIAIGQIDAILGIHSPMAETALQKLFYYVLHPPVPDWHTFVLAMIVIGIMIVFPRFNRTLPWSLVGLVLASAVAIGFGWQVPMIGTIPQTILLDARLTLSEIPWDHLSDLLTIAVSIAALGAIESLLCGAVTTNMTGQAFDSNQELIGQGIGNMIIPFFGGVPATAAIARSSVAIKSGGVTRITSFVHAFLLILSVFVLSPFMSQVPLAALGGVLLVTAWRMNEWESIRFFGRRGVRHALIGMLLTMVATVALDLTQAILIGVAASAVIYLRQSTESTSVTSAPVDFERIRAKGHAIVATSTTTHIYYLAGPLFFGNVHTVLEAFETAREYQTLVISMRGVPLVDVTGVQALIQIIEEHQQTGGEVCLSGLQENVEVVLSQAGVIDLIGTHNLFWSADQAIVTIDQRRSVKQSSVIKQHYTFFPPDRTVADVAMRDVYAVSVDTPASEIVTLLLDNVLRWLPVVDNQQRVVGIITEGDLLRRGVIRLPIAMKQLLPLTERAHTVLALAHQSWRASDLLTPDPIMVRSNDTLEAAAKSMVQHDLKRLPVVDQADHLMGVLDRSDLLATTVSHLMYQPASDLPVLPHVSLQQVADVLQRDIPVVQPTTSLIDVLQHVLSSPYRRVVVLENQKVIGLITDGDVLKRAARYVQPNVRQRLMTWFMGGELPAELVVALQDQIAADVMTSRVVMVEDTLSLVSAIQKLMDEDVVGLPVVNKEYCFQGWIDRTMVLHALIHINN
ncbi:MAG: CBS domain-containing protein [Chloroflexaceae bacterium]|nr:CBS domain-containing protein [Chloroflexaceae bacterium]